MNLQTNELIDSSPGTSEWMVSRDGAKQFIRCWHADADLAYAYVLYLHGIEGHSLWFQNTASLLQKNGVTTLALDRRGAGLSREARGDLKNWQQLLGDVIDAIHYTKKLANGSPLFLMANCWGAKLAALVAESHRPESQLISGLILSSPALDVKVDLSLIEKLNVAWRFVTRNKVQLGIPLEITDFTDNPLFLEFIENDKLRLTHATADFFVNTFILTLLSKSSANKIELPTLIVQSGIDNIVDITGVQNWFDKLKASDKSMQIFAETHHSLDFDRSPQSYQKLLLSWISDHSNLSSSQPSGAKKV